MNCEHDVEQAEQDFVCGRFEEAMIHARAILKNHRLTEYVHPDFESTKRLTVQYELNNGLISCDHDSSLAIDWYGMKHKPLHQEDIPQFVSVSIFQIGESSQSVEVLVDLNLTSTDNEPLEENISARSKAILLQCIHELDLSNDIMEREITEYIIPRQNTIISLDFAVLWIQHCITHQNLFKSESNQAVLNEIANSSLRLIISFIIYHRFGMDVSLFDAVEFRELFYLVFRHIIPFMNDKNQRNKILVHLKGILVQQQKNKYKWGDIMSCRYSFDFSSKLISLETFLTEEKFLLDENLSFVPIEIAKSCLDELNNLVEKTYKKKSPKNSQNEVFFHCLNQNKEDRNKMLQSNVKFKDKVTAYIVELFNKDKSEFYRPGTILVFALFVFRYLLSRRKPKHVGNKQSKFYSVIKYFKLGIAKSILNEFKEIVVK